MHCSFPVVIGDSVTGIESLSNNKFEFYPNPAHDLITITLPDNLERSYILRMVDLFGRETFRQALTDKINRVELNIDNGLYFLQVIKQTGELLEIKKLIVE